MHTFLPWEDIRQSEHMDFFSHCTADLQLPNLASFGGGGGSHGKLDLVFEALNLKICSRIFFLGPVRRLEALKSVWAWMLFLLLDHFFNSFCQKLQKKEDEPKKIKKTAAHLLALKRKTKIPIPKLFPPPKKKRGTHQLYQRTRPRLVTPQKNVLRS